MLKIYLPLDFEERYEKYRDMLLGILKEKEVKKKEMKEGIALTKIQPYCSIEGKWGLFKFNKYGKKIKIGRINSRHFKLLQSLTAPFGVSKTVDSVFEAIRIPKDNRDSKLSDFNTMKTRKIELIQWAIKELQKKKELKGRLNFQFSDNKREIRLEIL